VTVLVTGATGFLGTSLTRRLLSSDIRVRVLVRSASKARQLSSDGADTVVGDVTDRTAVEAAVRDVSVVYHLAGRLLTPDRPASEYHHTHVQGTKALIESCRRSRGVARFVHCSTTGVLGATGDHPADETAEFHPTNVYEATKAEAELAVRDAWRHGFPAVIVRPGLVYGPGDLHLLGFFRAVLRRRFRPIGRETAWLHPIYIDDMTEGLLHCGHNEAAVGECFHLAGLEPVPLEEFATAVARAGGANPARGRIPLPAARAVAAVGDRLPPRLRKAAPLTSSRVDFLTHSRVYDVSKAKRLLGFVAATDVPSGTARTVSWYRRHGYLR
jgi:nucleoside-diphosphate-sugar epimerase